MDAISDPKIERVTLQKSARVGYTKIINHVIGYHAHHDPCPILVVQPTLDDARGYSKDEIAPMLRDTPVLNGVFSESKSKDSDNTILKKLFPGGQLLLIGANSARGFRRVSMRVVLFDETDGYPISAGPEGDQIKLGIRRTEYYPNRKIIEGSTPTVTGASRIEKSFASAQQRLYYYVPCPHCQARQHLKWGNITWDKGAPETAYYRCECCKQAISHDSKRWMVEKGLWLDEQGEPLSPKTKHVAFHIWAAYSYSPNASWAALAEEFISIKDDKEQLQTFVNTVLGQTWEETGETVDEHMLFIRREHYAAPIPDGVLALTAGIDVQDDRFEIEVCGWGEGEESWSIDYIRLYGDISKQTIWNILAETLRKPYKREDGVMLDVRLACIDSGGHFTDEVYQFSKKYGRRWAVPTKGANLPGKPIADFPRHPNKKGVYLTMIGADTAKEVVYRRYSVSDPGPGYCHWPIREQYDEEYFAQATAEERMKKYMKGHAFYVWDAKRKRNEALDCRVLNLGAIRILQQHRGVDLARLAAQRTVDPEEQQQAVRPSVTIKSNIHSRFR